MNSLAWITSKFELYCVASPHSNRNAISQSANKIAKWVQQEEERIFIIGGAVSFLQCEERIRPKLTIFPMGQVF
jgi:putative NADH-flavin reductase